MGEILDNQNTQEENTEQTEALNQPEKIEESSINGVQKPKTKFFTSSGLYSFLLIFGIVFLVSLYFFQVFMSPIKVVGKSMQPTINASVLSDADEDHCDIVYYHKQTSYTNDDIVIISNEGDKYVTSADPEKKVDFIIKRVIACPGDSITFFVTNYKSGTYYYDIAVKKSDGSTVNLDDSYLKEEMKFSYTEYLSNKFYYKAYDEIFSELVKSTSDNYTSFTMNIKDNEYFVMGDNRNHSEDSRYFGSVSVDTISGKVMLQVPYGSNIWQALWIKLKEQL